MQCSPLNIKNHLWLDAKVPHSTKMPNWLFYESFFLGLCDVWIWSIRIIFLKFYWDPWFTVSSWGILGDSGRSYEILADPERSWKILEDLVRFWEILEDPWRSWYILGDLSRSWEILEDHWRSWHILGDLGKSWEILADPGRSWQILGDLRRSCETLGNNHISLDYME